MSGFLLDTNVVSEGMKAATDAAIMMFLDQREAFHLSVVTLHELRYGVEITPDGKRKDALQASVETLESRYRETIIAVDRAIAQAAAEMRAAARGQGRILHLPDALIAATAQTRGLTIATRNIRDFDGCGAALFNPWDAPV